MKIIFPIMNLLMKIMLFFYQNIQINLIICFSYPYIISVFQDFNNYTNIIIEEYLEINNDNK